jgi:hypothetical protein
VFRKQRMNERTEMGRARRAMQRCIAERHTAEDEYWRERVGPSWRTNGAAA